MDRPDLFPATHPFCTTRKIIVAASRLRLVSPSEGEARPTTSLQSEHLGGRGSYWFELGTWPEVARKPALPTFPRFDAPFDLPEEWR